MPEKRMAILFVIGMLACAFCVPAPTTAQTTPAALPTATELQSQIDTQNQALTSLNAEIAQYESQLQQIGSNKDTLTNEIKKLTVESQKLQTDISVSQGKITLTNLQIQSLNDTIGTTAAEIADLKSAIAKDIAMVNIQDNDSLSDILLSSGNFSSLWHYIGEQNAFQEGLEQKTAQLVTTEQALTASKTQVEADKSNLVAVTSQLQDQNTINQQTAAQKNSLLKTTKNQETAYQKLVDQKLAAKNQMTEDLAEYESKLTYVLNPTSLPPPGSAPLAWPLSNIVITQLFGKTEASGRLYVTGTHNGVDFGANVGTPVKALADGTVIGTGNSDLSCLGASYGKWVFIKYDDGLASVFGHLSLIKTTASARVTTGEVVAYSGETGYATGPHLHVSIFANGGVSINTFPSQACVGKYITIPTAAANAYLDPMLYFPPLPKK